MYQDQSGALNESFADVFGCLTVQYKKKQTAGEATWLIGDGLLGPGIQGKALRSMRAPGTAYNDPILGKDPQPYHNDHYVNTQSDRGGVHINSEFPTPQRVLSFCPANWEAMLAEKARSRSGIRRCKPLTTPPTPRLWIGLTARQCLLPPARSLETEALRLPCVREAGSWWY